MMNALWPAALLAMLSFGCASSDGVRHHAAVGAIGPYSGSVVVDGLCFLSGKIAPDERASGQFVEEVDGVIDAVSSELATAGAALTNVASVTVFLTDMDQFAEFNEVYAQRFPPPYPARTTVAVSSLPAGRRIEMAVIAVIPGTRPSRVVDAE